MSAEVPECLNKDCPTLECVGPIYPDDPECTEWRCTASEACEEIVIKGPTVRSTWDDADSETEEYEIPEFPKKWYSNRDEAVELRSHNRLSDLPSAHPVNVAYIPALPAAIPVASPPPEEEAKAEAEGEDDESTMDVEGESEGWGFESEACLSFPRNVLDTPPEWTGTYVQEYLRKAREEKSESFRRNLDFANTLAVPPRRPTRTASSHSGIAPPSVIDLSHLEEKGTSDDPIVLE